MTDAVSLLSTLKRLETHSSRGERPVPRKILSLKEAYEHAAYKRCVYVLMNHSQKVYAFCNSALYGHEVLPDTYKVFTYNLSRELFKCKNRDEVIQRALLDGRDDWTHIKTVEELASFINK